jgi:hypothetical protein
MNMKMREAEAGSFQKAAGYGTKQVTYEFFQNRGKNIDCRYDQGVCSFTLEACCLKTASDVVSDDSTICPYTLEKVDC